MDLTEIRRIFHTIGRRFTNPQENPMTIREMAWLYIQRRLYLRHHRLPAIGVPLAFAIPDPSPPPRIAVIVHCYYVDLLDEMLRCIRHIPFAWQLFVSTDTEEKCSQIMRLIQTHRISDAVVRIAPNRGRDMAPKYITFRDVYNHCDFFLHLHSKKSPHTGSFGVKWREHLLNSLVGSPDIIRSNLRLLADPRLGLVFPAALNETLPRLRWGANFAAAAALAPRLGIEIRPEFCPDYPDGGMYWGKPSAIKPILDLNLRFEDFQEEKGQLDGGRSHVLERTVVLAAQCRALSGCRVTDDPAAPGLLTARDEHELAAAIAASLAAQKEEELAVTEKR